MLEVGRLFRRFARLLIGALALASPLATAADGVTVDHTWRRDDTLTTVLYRYGLGRSTGTMQIYGPDGWLARNQRANPSIKNWANIPPGTNVHIVLPKRLVPGTRPVKVRFGSLVPSKPQPVAAKRAAAKPHPEGALTGNGAVALVNALEPLPPTKVTPSTDEAGLTLGMSPETQLTLMLALLAFATATWPTMVWVNGRRRIAASERLNRIAFWQERLTRLFHCPASEFDILLAQAIVGPVSDDLLPPLLTAPLGDNAHEEVQRRAVTIYQRIRAIDTDRAGLASRRTEDRLDAALRLSAVGASDLTDKIVAAFEKTPRARVPELFPIFVHLARYDSDGLLRVLPKINSVNVLRAAIRALGVVDLPRAAKEIEAIAKAYPGEPELIADAVRTLKRLKVASQPKAHRRTGAPKTLSSSTPMTASQQPVTRMSSNVA